MVGDGPEEAGDEGHVQPSEVVTARLPCLSGSIAQSRLARGIPAAERRGDRTQPRANPDVPARRDWERAGAAPRLMRRRPASPSRHWARFPSGHDFFPTRPRWKNVLFRKSRLT